MKEWMDDSKDFLFRKTSHQEMPSEYLFWMDIRVCFPFTLLAISLCYMVRFHPLVVYYLNLRTASLILLITRMVLVQTRGRDSLERVCTNIFMSVGLVSVYITMIIALERCFFIFRPQQHCISQAKGSVIICALVWVLCMLISPVLMFFDLMIVLLVFGAIPSLVVIICPIVTCICLPGASSVSAEEKRRSVATLVLFMVIYGVTIARVLLLFNRPYYLLYEICIWTVLGHFMDMFLFVFMRKGPIDKLLTCLCCCRMETSAVDDGSRLSAGL